jgi:hypothetical protein
MSERRHTDAPAGDAREREHTDEPFLKRWSRLKADSASAKAQESPVPVADEPTAARDGAEPEPLPPSDEDMPPLETLDENSDFSGFMSPRVSAGLRKQALRKLFRSARFNVISELDDYIDDYRNYPALGDIVTSDMKHAAAELLKRQLEAGEVHTAAGAETEGAAPAATGEEVGVAAAGAAGDDQPAGQDVEEHPDPEDNEEPSRDA